MADDQWSATAGAQELWSATLSYMDDQGYLSPRDSRFLRSIAVVGLFDTMLILSVADDAARATLENKLNADITECLSHMAQKAMTFIVKIDQPDNQPDKRETETKETGPSIPGSPAQPESDSAFPTRTDQTAQSPQTSQPPRFSQPQPPQSPQPQREERGEGGEGKEEKTNETYRYGLDPYQPASYGMHQDSRSRADVDQSESGPISQTEQISAFTDSSDNKTQQNSFQGSFQGSFPSENLPFEEVTDEDEGPKLQSAQTARNAITHLNPFATFDTFVQGTSNRFAKSAAVMVAESPGTVDYNPLFIYGESGLGKTHLLNAIGNYVLRQDPTMIVRYVTAEEFVNDFVSALTAGARKQAALANFTKKYRNVDVLLLDDIQFFRGSETMEQFFHTFNELVSTGKQIVIASDVAPNHLKGFNERLRTRFNNGLVVDVAPPEKDTRLAILRLKASNSNIEVPADVLDYIADKITDSVRELEGALTRVTAIATLNNQPVTHSLAEQTLHDFFNSDVEVTPTNIITNVAQHYQLTFDDIVGPSRTKNVAEARQVSMYLIREMTGLSLVDIGEVFGGRDHSTVMHACKKVANEISEKRNLYNNVNEITMRIKQADSPKTV